MQAAAGVGLLPRVAGRRVTRWDQVVQLLGAGGFVTISAAGAKRWWDLQDQERARKLKDAETAHQDAVRERDRERDEAIRLRENLERRVDSLEDRLGKMFGELQEVRERNLGLLAEANQLRAQLAVVVTERDQALKIGTAAAARVLELEAIIVQLHGKIARLEEQVERKFTARREVERGSDVGRSRDDDGGGM